MWGRKIAVAVLTGAIVLTPVAAIAAPVYPAPPAPQTGVIPDDPEVDVDDESEEVVVETKKVATTTDAAPTLSETGFESLPMALGAGALLLGGAATVIISARRTSTGTRV